jgi:hypothetical protein
VANLFPIDKLSIEIDFKALFENTTRIRPSQDNEEEEAGIAKSVANIEAKSSS